MKRAAIVQVRLALGPTPAIVGRLAFHGGRAIFECDAAFPIARLNLSPFRFKPVGTNPLPGPALPFDGLHGLFADSLPDGWGRLLADRVFRKAGIDPQSVTPVERLARVGTRGMGALTYHPEIDAGEKPAAAIDLDRIAAEAIRILEDKTSKSDERLRLLAANSGGARPKAAIWISPDGACSAQPARDAEAWLVKFPSHTDDPAIGRIEYAYSLMMRDAGIDVPQTRLLVPKRRGYFATKRFDRRGAQRLHVHTLAGLLECDFRAPTIGYREAHKAVHLLTRDKRQVEEMFRRMCFNVLAKNKDDHPKNHSFVMDATGAWRLAPAYDVVLSAGSNGEHALIVGHAAKDPQIADLLLVGKDVGLSQASLSRAIDRVRSIAANWKIYADQAGLARRTQDAVAAALAPASKRHRS